jgi:hypothetical protein
MKNKITPIVIMLICLTGMFLVPFPFPGKIPSVRGDPSGWVAGFSYRKKEVISQTTGAGIGYQVAFITFYGSGTDGNITQAYFKFGSIYLNGHCNYDFSDIRFTASDGKTLLCYWRENSYAYLNATFWVKLTDDLTVAPSTLYIYYGNPSAFDISSGTRTFPLYDDFNILSSLNTSLWNNENPDGTCEVGTYTMPYFPGETQKCLHIGTSSYVAMTYGTPCVPSDIGKNVNATGVGYVGKLLDYSNGVPDWIISGLWMYSHYGSLSLFIVGGTGAGTSGTTNNVDTGGVVESVPTFGLGYAVRCRCANPYPFWTWGECLFGFGTTHTSTDYTDAYITNSVAWSAINSISSGSGTMELSPYLYPASTDSPFWTVNVGRNNTGNCDRYWGYGLGYTEQYYATSGTISSYIPQGNLHISMIADLQQSGVYESSAYYDWILVRKYMDPEPAHISGTGTGIENKLNVGIKLPDLEAGGWVFCDWKFYTFNITAQLPGSGYWSFVSLSFLDQAKSNCTILYDVVHNQFTVWNQSTEENKRYIRISQVMSPMIQDPVNNETFYFDFEIWFTSNLVDTYIKPVDIYMWGNWTGGSISWIFPGQFKIYNKGGDSLDYHSSNLVLAHRITGADVFEFYAQGNSSSSGFQYVYNDFFFRNLQHIKELYQINARVAYPGFSCSYGMDYYTQKDGWVPGWYVDLIPMNITNPRATGSNCYWCWYVTWYFRNTLVKTDYVFTFPDGNPQNNGEFAYTRLWVDLWFNMMNGSSVWGGRINSYYYPMVNNADPWLRILSSSWGVDDKKNKESECFGRLTHNDGSTCQSQEIIFERAWSELGVNNDPTYNQQVTQMYADVQDLTLGKVPLTGIDTPAFDETKVPTMQQGGFLGCIIAGFSAIGKWLADNIIWGGLSLWGNFVGFLDTIGALLGHPHFFSDLFTAVIQDITYFVDSFGYMISLVYDFFLLIWALFSSFVITLGNLIAALLNTLTIFQNIMNGTIGAGGNVWNQLNISGWILLFLIFYPLYLLILWEDEGSDAVMRQLNFIFGIAVGLFNFFEMIISHIVSIAGTIIESIPVVE